MRLLDLFCGAGGAAMGYHQAGFDEIIGIDNKPQPDYPFTFIQADALNPPLDLDGFDLIHASPPCQAYSAVTVDKDQHPDLLRPTHQMLMGHDSVIENVPNSPIQALLMLCGSMFNMQIQRHRYFELVGFPLLLVQPCNHKAWEDGRPWSITGDPGGETQGIKGGRDRHKYRNHKHAQELMEMPWVIGRGVVEAIPPAYTKFIGEQFLANTVR